MPDAPKMIFVNLPVTDLKASIAFYEAVGATRNDNFADAQAQAMVISDTIYVMLLTYERFSSFTSRKIPNAHETAQMLLCLSENSRADVEAMVDKALAAGGTHPNPVQDHGFMYGSNFADPDGHIWEVVWMDPAAIPSPEEATAAA
ncbi:MAG: VOC family protein [Sphingobium sp.]